MGIPFDQLKSQNDIVDIIGRFVHVTKRGTEYYGTCPFHDDDHASLQINDRKQIFKCFACGAGGDVFDFLIKHGKTLPEAVAFLEGDHRLITDSKPQQSKAKAKKQTIWKPTPPAHVPDSFEHYRHGQPSMRWAYHRADGQLLSYVCRFDTPDGKEVLPYTFCTDGKRNEWRWQGLEKPRPLYRLHEIIAQPGKTVIVVEGEKTADALARLVEPAGKSIVTTWIGGANGIANTDFTVLNGRKVMLWPDNDFSHRYGEKHPTLAGRLKPFEEQPGNAAMLQIASIIQPAILRFIKNPDEKPCGWDVADEPSWTGEIARHHILSSSFEQLRIVSDWQQLYDAENTPPPPPPVPELPPDQPFDYSGFVDEEPEGNGYGDNLIDNPHFRFLGYINDSGRPVHCFYPNGSKLIVKLTTSQITVSSLIDLAPLSYWEYNFPAKRSSIDVNAATNWLANTSQAVGVFSPKMIRGRGAWWDDNRTVVHSGSHLVVDGAQTPLGKHKTRYIYEVGEPLGFTHVAPLTTTEASKLVDVIKLLNWDREVNSHLLAGWCVVAPICGALKWRPHIWITGSAGTGKSWVFKEIVRRLLGETGLAVQGETSEAGLRQSLGHDALPVVFDEAEAEDKRAQERIQTILTLMRSASADDGGVMAKGSAGGSAVTYRIRSCFAFASISMSVSQQSDRSRVTILGMKRLREDDPQRAIRWRKLQHDYNELITDEFVHRLLSRTLSMVPIIIKNAATFANAAAAVIGGQRTGDQLGALLAGAYSLYSSKEISFADAVKWVSERDWAEEKSLDSTRDETVLFAHLMEQIVRVESDSGMMRERQIGELIQYASYNKVDANIGGESAGNRLRQLGFKVDGDRIVISNSANEIRKMLGGTAWSKNHHRILLRLDGAVELQSTRFAAGLQTRAVSLPLSLLIK